MKLSIVIPAYNEVESLPVLIEAVVKEAAPFAPFEILIMDDGSTDGSEAVIQDLADRYPQLGWVSFGRNYGKSAALAVAFSRSRGERVITMDADLQDDPAEIPALLARMDEGWDLVSGWKKTRRDPPSKTLPSKLFNAVMRKVTGLDLHDFNCGLKAYDGQLARGLRLYGEMHRFVPALAGWQGYRVTEIPVRHHERRFGESKFGARRFLNGMLDLMTITFIARRSTAPLHFFGRLAFWLLAVGSAINFYFGVLWILRVTGMADNVVLMRPLLVGGLVMVVLGLQFASLGLLGELMIHTRGRDEQYRIKGEEAPRAK